MKVYIVTYCEQYESDEVIGVFATEERARQAVQYQITRTDWAVWQNSRKSFHHYLITEEEVIE